MIVDEGLELLTEEQACALLATGEVGRVGITIGALPAIFPVNYRVIDGAVVFRTSPGSKMSAAAEGAVVAFEVDDYQLADRSGWSVLAVGPPEIVHDLDLAFKGVGAPSSCGSSPRSSPAGGSCTRELSRPLNSACIAFVRGQWRRLVVLAMARQPFASVMVSVWWRRLRTCSRRPWVL